MYIEEPIIYWVTELWTNPLVFSTEILGISFLLFILIHNKLYHKKEIIHYFKGINQPLIQKFKEEDFTI